MPRFAACVVGFPLDGRPQEEEHVFDVARLVEAHQALGERFDFVF